MPSPLPGCGVDLLSDSGRCLPGFRIIFTFDDIYGVVLHVFLPLSFELLVDHQEIRSFLQHLELQRAEDRKH